MDNFDLKKYLAEGKLFEEDKSYGHKHGISILTKLFNESYIYPLEDKGYSFLDDAKVGELEIIEFENDGIFIDSDEFDIALEYLSGLNNLPEVIEIKGYTVTFEKQGDIIVATFEVK